MLLRSAGVRPGHKPGPRKVHRVEGSADINGAAGKVPHLFRMLEEDVRKGKFQPLPEEGALKYGPVTPGYDVIELVDKDMKQLRKVCIGPRRAELTAAKEHARARAAAKDAAHAQPTPHSGSRRASAAPTSSGTRASKSGPDAPTRSLT
jgi:hypothetical protein